MKNFNGMPSYSEESKALIKNLRQHGWSARRMLKEFPEKTWTRSGLDDIIRRIDQNGTAERVEGSGRPRTQRTEENVALVESLVISDDDEPGTHKSPREIEQHTGLSRSTVRRIVKEDLNLRNFRRQKAQLLSESNREQRRQRVATLLGRFPPHTVRRIWFTDEKCFTVRNPINSQNDRVYAPISIKKSEVPPEKLLRQQPHFTKKLMVSVGVSKLGKTRIVFIDEGAKVNAVYYTESVLKNGLLPDIRRISGDRFVLQQDGARSHTARHTIQFLDQHVPAYIEPEHWPANSPDLNPVDYRIWGALQQKVYYNTRIEDLNDLRREIVRAWDEISQRFVNAAIDQWCDRLRACVDARGGHFEHLF